MGRKANKERFLKEKRQELVNDYNRALAEYGKDHTKTRFYQKKIIDFDNSNKK